MAVIFTTETSRGVVTTTSTVRIVTSGIGIQGPPGADGAGTLFDAENKSGATLAAGTAVAIHSSGTGTIKAIATAYSTLTVGLAAESTSSAVSGDVQTSGPLTLANWAAITGTTELAARGRYYLSATTAGMLTTTAPSTGIVQFVGVAISPTTLDIDPGEGILL